MRKIIMRRRSNLLVLTLCILIILSWTGGDAQEAVQEKGKNRIVMENPLGRRIAAIMDTCVWTAYRDDEFGFEIIRPRHMRLIVFEPKGHDKHLNKFYMSDGSFEITIHVYRNETDIDTHVKLLSYIREHYGNDDLLDGYERIEYAIGGHPAIRHDYFYPSEGNPYSPGDPATFVYTSSDTYVYKIGLCCHKELSDRILSTFRIID